jgi:hypothetical protein
MGPGIPAPSSSGDVSELEEFAPLPNLGHAGNDLHDLHSVSEGSDVEYFRNSSASSFIGLPQVQLLSSNNLESITIDDYLTSANESAAMIEQGLQVSMGLEPKGLATQSVYAMSDSQAFDKAMVNTDTALSMTAPATDALWATALFDPSSMDETNPFAASWVQ